MKVEWSAVPAFLLLAGLLAGCAPTAPAPDDAFYDLPVVAEVAAGPLLTDGVLQIARLRAEGVQAERAILFSRTDDAVVLDRYHYHFWASAPGYLLRDHLRDYLEQARPAGKLTTEPGMPADLQVRGHVRQLLHLPQAAPPAVLVTLELQLLALDEARPLLLETYTERQEVAGGSMEMVVRAMAEALNRIYARFLADARRVTAR